MAANNAIKEYLRRSLFSHDSRTNRYYLSESSKNALSTLTRMLERSVEKGEGNSVVVTGPSGAGKSWIVGRSLDSLKNNTRIKNDFVTINLNGMVHTDDRYAMLGIAQQLNLASQLGDTINLSFAAALDHILEIIRSGNKQNKCVIFVLEEFDLFAKHKNQTLLYNLFDLAQSPVNPIVVVGVTPSLDFLELLEKRVKSRFSHRIIHLFPPDVFEDYLLLFQSLLEVPNHISNSKLWNKHINELAQDHSVLSLLRTVFYYSSDVGSLRLMLGHALSQLSDDHSYLSCQLLQDSLSQCSFSSDWWIPLIHGLSVMEVSLLVASKHVAELNHDEPINFEMIFDEYSKFVSGRSHHTVESLSKPVVLKSFEKLVTLELLCPVSNTESKSTMKEYQLILPKLENRLLVEGVKTYKHCPTDLSFWVEKEPSK